MICATPSERSPDGIKRLLAVALLIGLSPVAQAQLFISDALMLAAEHDPAYAGAFAARTAEREVGEQGRAGLRPTVGISAGGQLIATDSRFAFGEEKDEYSAWSAMFEARQPLLRWDWRTRLDRADAQDALADAQFRQRQTDFVVRVALRYFDALQAQDQLLLARAEVAAVERSLGDVQKRFDVDLVPGVDLKEAQARFDLSRAQLIRAEAERERAEDALIEVTGPFQGPLPRLKQALDLPEPPSSAVDHWLALMEENSASLHLAALRLQVAEHDRASRKALARPSADLVASAGRIDSSEFALGSRQDEARIGVEVNIPLYSGGLISSQTREAEARVEEARFERERVIREARRQIRMEFRDFEAAQITDRALQRALASARAAEAAVRAGYDAGTRTITDVLDAQRRIVEAERDLHEARYNLLVRMLSLQAVAGTLSLESAMAIDSLLELR